MQLSGVVVRHSEWSATDQSNDHATISDVNRCPCHKSPIKPIDLIVKKRDSNAIGRKGSYDFTVEDAEVIISIFR